MSGNYVSTGEPHLVIAGLPQLQLGPFLPEQMHLPKPGLKISSRTDRDRFLFGCLVGSTYSSSRGGLRVDFYHIPPEFDQFI